MIGLLLDKYPGTFKNKFSIDEDKDEVYILEEYTKQRNLLKSGGETDIQRGAKMLIDDFRNNKLGYLTLDKIPASEQ